MPKPIKLESFHTGSNGERVDHALGVLSWIDGRRRLIFRYREDDCDTELVLDERPDREGDFRAVFSYPTDEAPDQYATAHVASEGDGWIAVVTGKWDGEVFVMPVHAPRKPEE